MPIIHDSSFFESMVYLAGTIAGISVGIVAVFAIFVPEQMLACALIVGALCIMGLGLGMIMSRHASQDARLPAANAAGA
jgi:hypothetical protein